MIEKRRTNLTDGPGRPRRYTDEQATEWADHIQEYIDSITYWETVTEVVDTGEYDEKGNKVWKEVPKLNNKGEPIKRLQFAAVPSTLGFGLYIGMNKDEVSQHAAREGFDKAYKNLRDLIEEYTASQLMTRKNVAGVIFSLKNNFGWQDKKEVEVTSKTKLEDFFE